MDYDAQEAFKAGWLANEEHHDHEWGPEPPKTPEAAFARWLKTCRLGHIVSVNGCVARLPDGRYCSAVNR